MNGFPQIISGDIFRDGRGEVAHLGEFSFDNIRRLYTIKNKENVVRAWHGHKIETKIFYVVSGIFKICCAKIDDWDNPSSILPVEDYTLSEKEGGALLVPGGYANGLVAKCKDAKVLILSNLTLEESLKDDYRFNKELWYSWENDL